MKILILTAVYPPLGYSGHDDRCQQVAAALSRRGHRLQVLTSNYRKPPMGVVGERGVFRQLYLHDSSDVESRLGASYSATFDYELSNTRTLSNRVDNFEPDLVYVWNLSGLSKSLLFSLQSQKIPIVYDLHTNWLSADSFETDPWYRWWHKNESIPSRLYRACQRVTGVARRRLSQMPIGTAAELDLSNAYVCSHSLRNELIKAGLPLVDVLPIIFPALDTNRVLSKINHQPVRKFMWAGHLTYEKAPELALEAIDILRSRGVLVSLDIFGLGSPSERKVMRERIDASRLSSLVKMVGIRPGELAQYYPFYDALLFTSRCNDPFPVTPLEAMLSCLPCILSKDGGIQEIVEDEKTAFFYDVNDASSLADAMMRLIDLADGGCALATRCMEILQINHSLDRVVERLETILTSALRSKA
jgi:glycogen synthase